MQARSSAALVIVAWTATITVLAAGGCGSGATAGSGSGAPSTLPTTQERVSGTDAGADAPDSGKKVFKPDQTAVAVLAGEKFAFRLPEDPTEGQAWKVISAPDERLVKPDGDSFKAEVPAPGSATASAGQHEFKYKARAAGSTTVTFSRCAACASGAADPSRTTFTITIS